MFLKYTLGNFSFDLKNISVALEYGTKHKVNNIILQRSFEDKYCHLKIWSPKKKRTRWSFIPTSSASEVNYHYKKCVAPKPITFHENEASDFILDDSNKRHFLWTLLRYKATEFRIPSWTGFQISVSNDIPLLKTTVGYLDCIDSSATEMSTVYQVWSTLLLLIILKLTLIVFCIVKYAVFTW